MATPPKISTSAQKRKNGTTAPSPAPKRPTKRSKPKKRRRSAPQPAPGSKAFYNLQAAWDKKLAESDFKDLEHRATGNIQGTNIASRAFKERYRFHHAHTTHHFSRWSCYLERQNEAELTRCERYTIEQYAAGVEIFPIFKAMRRRQWYKKSQWSFYYIFFPALAARVEAWNRTNPHGMDFIADIGISD